MKSRRGAGAYTLLEILFVLLIVAVLVALAVPAYRQQAMRTYRVEAVRTLNAAAACLERQRELTGYYDTSRCLSGADNERYAFSATPEAESRALTFTLTATPRGPQQHDPCGSLGLNRAGTRTASGGEEVLRCWGGR